VVEMDRETDLEKIIEGANKKIPDSIVDAIKEASKSFKTSLEYARNEVGKRSYRIWGRRYRFWGKMEYYLKQYCEDMLSTEQMLDLIKEEGEFLDFTLMLRKFKNKEDIRGYAHPNNRFIRLLKDLSYISKIGSVLKDVAVFKPASGYTVSVKALCKNYSINHGKLLALRLTHDLFYREGSVTRGRYGLTETAEKVLHALGYKNSELEQHLYTTV